MSYTQPNPSDICHILSQMSPKSNICVDSFLHHILSCPARHEAYWRQTTKQASIQCWKRLAFVSQPPLTWQQEPQHMSRQSQEERQNDTRKPRKEKHNWGWWENMSARVLWDGWRVAYWCKATMTNKMQIVIINNQTSLTADSWRCLIDSNSVSEVLEEICLSLKLQQTFLIDVD